MDPCFDGLITAAPLDKEITGDALHEVTQLLDAHGRRGAHSSAGEMAEIGVSFVAAAKHSRRQRPPYTDAAATHTLASFPAVACLLEHATQRLGRRVPERFDPVRLNVIVRRYSPGQGLKMHTDRTPLWGGTKAACFEEPVYGCVLENTSPQSLVFRHGALTHALDEKTAGPIAFLQTGPARFACQHGVPVLTEGRRVSVTWRWLVSDGGDEPASDSFCENMPKSK